VILFAVSTTQIAIGGRPGDWQHQLALAAVVYLIGWSAGRRWKPASVPRR
jgi:hypothetical protein